MIQWSIDLIIFTNWTHFIRILLDFIKSIYFQQYCMNHKCYRFIELSMKAKAFFKWSQVKSQFSIYLKLLTENDRKWAIGPANESILQNYKKYFIWIITMRMNSVSSWLAFGCSKWNGAHLLGIGHILTWFCHCYHQNVVWYWFDSMLKPMFHLFKHRNRRHENVFDILANFSVSKHSKLEKGS